MHFQTHQIFGVMHVYIVVYNIMRRVSHVIDVNSAWFSIHEPFKVLMSGRIKKLLINSTNMGNYIGNVYVTI